MPHNQFKKLTQTKLKTNITYIVSNINKALAFEWIADFLNKDRFKLNFILLNPGNSELEQFLLEKNIAVDRITYKSKKDLLGAIYRTYQLLKRHQTTVVHTHLFDANMVGLTAAKLARIKKRIYTRHHSDFHHTYFPKAVKYDKYINWLATDIVAISLVVKDILIKKEKVDPIKIHLIYHGFDLNKFSDVEETTITKLGNKYNPSYLSPVVGVISRYLELKGIQYIIPAFKQLLGSHPDALLILANTQGAFKEEIEKLLEQIPKRNYVEIQFEAHIFELYKLFDIFVHVPIAKEIEAFGQTYVESLASGVPSIFTLSGIANEFVVNRNNAMVVNYKSSEEIYTAMNELLSDNKLARQLIDNGQKVVKEKFGIREMIVTLEKLYE